MTRYVKIDFENNEYLRLKGMKGDNRTWKEFVLQLAGIQKKVDDDK